MKTITFLLVHLFTFTIPFLLFSQEPVPNQGFENWNAEVFFSNPEPYQSLNLISYLTTGTSNVYPIQGINGSAAYLETKYAALTGDTIPGALIIGDLSSGNLSGGIPFTSQPDSLSGYFKYDIQPGDTASILAIFQFNSLPVNIAFFQFTGSQLDFEYQAVDIPPFLFPVDSLILIINSGALPGSWLALDELHFTISNDQIPNNDFEIWNDAEFQQAEGWNAFNFLPTLFESPAPLTKTTDAANGDFAARLETVEIDFFGEVDTIGFLSTGESQSPTGEPVMENIPFTSGPSVMFVFDYKYIPADNNVALVNLVFSENGDMVHDTIFEIPESPEYTTAEYLLDLPATADSVAITFASSDFREATYHVVPGDVLYLDDMYFVIGSNTSEVIYTDQIKTYPNPAKGSLHIDFQGVGPEAKSITFYNLYGQAVWFKKIEQPVNQLELDVASWVPGLYTYVLETEEGAFSGKMSIVE